MSCPTDTLGIILFHNGTRIRTPVLMRFRNIHVAQPRNKTTPRQATRGIKFLTLA